MSKRNSVGASNTLFNYFTKTPPANKKPKTINETVESPKVNTSLKEEQENNERKKRERQVTASPEDSKHNSDSDDEVPIVSKKRKRIRLNPVESDDSDVENKADNKIETVKEKVEKKLQESFKYTPSNSPKSSKTIKPVVENSTSSSKSIESHETQPLADDSNWTHCKLEFLKPDNIRDAQKRRPDHPDYDPSTLYVPPDFYKNQTPAHRQWWEMKSSHYDCVLFFKVGKFYELYHMDAAVGVNELGFSYMKGEFAHSGFPESAYARMVSTLVSKGYKVARVEQTETPDMMQERCRKSGKNTKWDKVVRREICQVTLRGAQVCGLQDPGPPEPSAAYMLAVAEEDNNGCSTYGVCFVDTSIGLFHMGQFADDKHSSRLLTTLAHYPPALITYDRRGTSARTSRLLGTHCPGARREPRALPPPEKVLAALASNYYRSDADGDWPEGLKPFLHEGDALGLTPAPGCHLAVRALGGCAASLSDCLLDIQVLGMAQFTAYEPPDAARAPPRASGGRWEGGNTMVLDAVTLRNLRIVQDEGCLYSKLNFCSTPMGKRLLHEWVCAPSCNISVIRERQAAVRELFENQELCQDAKSILTTLPDLERLLAKVHSLGNLQRSKQHPDSRAIFYEQHAYSKRKVLDFTAVLNGFAAALRLNELFAGAGAALLKRITQYSPEGQFPDYKETLKFFKEAFNQSQAEKEGRIVPGAGVDREYDGALLAVQEVEARLQDYLTRQEKLFKCRLSYVGTDKKRYQIEVPQGACARAGPEYQLEGARKGFKRFSTQETKELLSQMQAAEEQKSNVLKDLSRRMFEKFSSHHAQWAAAGRALAALDVLLALAEFARQLPGAACLPELSRDTAVQPYIEIEEGRHPCIPCAEEFIPNDTRLGLGASLLLLTGPNMGGKSTLMRQVGLLAVLAHLGSYVPARRCRLSAVDRIFTRLGASDDILAGQSTFLVEMSETAAIVRHATRHSLVLLDELGRGTSTHDGTALASGVCAELAARGARVLFSTHYHALVRHLRAHPAVQLGHMACMVETEEPTADDDDDGDGDGDDDQIPEETITFLYKLCAGACPKSYGFNAARLAGVPRALTRRARRVSRRLEREAACVRAFRALARPASPASPASPAGVSHLRDLLAGLDI